MLLKEVKVLGFRTACTLDSSYVNLKGGPSKPRSIVTSWHVGFLRRLFFNTKDKEKGIRVWN